MKFRSDEKSTTYEVNITKPPIAPPNEEFIMFPFIGRVSTKKSIREREEYSKYLQEYGKSFDK